MSGRTLLLLCKGKYALGLQQRRSPCWGREPGVQTLLVSTAWGETVSGGHGFGLRWCVVLQQCPACVFVHKACGSSKDVVAFLCRPVMEVGTR